MEFKDFKSALQSYRRLKSFCDGKKRFKEKIVCYGQIGHVHSLQDEHNSSIKFYHKMLELAWEQGDERYEIQACDALGMAYYYAGDLEKSKHFNDRMMRGKIECEDSVIKRVSNNLIQAKRTRPKYEFYLNPDQLAEYLQKKQAQIAGTEEEVRADFGISKAHRILPNYVGKEENTNENARTETPADAIKRKLQ